MYYFLWLVAVCLLPTWLVAAGLLLTGNFLAASIVIIVAIVFHFRGL